MGRSIIVGAIAAMFVAGFLGCLAAISSEDRRVRENQKNS
jgi:hypothetical protein